MDRGLENGAVGLGPALRPHPHLHPRYRKAFDVEPSLHSGINAAVLLIAAGQRFEDSEELQLIGESQPWTGQGRARAERTPGWSLALSLLDLSCQNPHLDPHTRPGPS